MKIFKLERFKGNILVQAGNIVHELSFYEGSRRFDTNLSIAGGFLYDWFAEKAVK